MYPKKQTQVPARKLATLSSIVFHKRSHVPRPFLFLNASTFHNKTRKDTKIMSPTGLLDNYIASPARENLPYIASQDRESLPYSAVLSVENRFYMLLTFSIKGSRYKQERLQ